MGSKVCDDEEEDKEAAVSHSRPSGSRVVVSLGWGDNSTSAAFNDISILRVTAGASGSNQFSL